MTRLWLILLITLPALFPQGERAEVRAQDAKELYHRGKDLYDAKDYAQALPLLQNAAAKGHRKAQYRLARCYDKGHGIAEDDAVAFQWYLKSAEQDYAKAQFRVGECYKEGRGVEKSRKTAFKWFLRAAKQDYAEAQYQVGKAYLRGKGTDTDAKKARSWLLKAMKNPKGGDQIVRRLRKKADGGDTDAAAILQMP